MNYKECLIDIQRRERLVGEAADLATAASEKYQAHMTLYKVGVMTADKTAIEQNREILHNLLDQILDTTYEVGTHQREINIMIRSVKD